MASVERAPVIGQRFQPGEVILHRMFTAEHLVFVRTARVIGHDERGLRLWIARGCPLAVRMSADGRGLRDMPFREWIEQPTVLETTVWRGPDIFMLVPPDRAHSVYWFWNSAGAFDGWYVNLEDRAVLWRDGELAGLDTCDHDLDIWVAADRAWYWKDVHELTERLEFPEHYWVSDPDAVWAEGRYAVSLVEAGRFPFDGTWCDFRPDRGWPVPGRFPAGWDQPRIGPAAPTVCSEMST